MHKKFYFAGAFVILGIFMGILGFTGLGETGFANRGHVPIVVVLGVSGAFILGGLLFILLGGSTKK